MLESIAAKPCSMTLLSRKVDWPIAVLLIPKEHTQDSAFLIKMQDKHRCFYCRQPWTVQHPTASPLGILTCAVHVAEGQRDWATHMHELGYVRVCDAVAAAPDFFALLTDKFSIPGPKAGDPLDPGWRVDPKGMMYRKNGKWYMPIFKRDAIGDLGQALFGASARATKSMSLSAFLLPEMGYKKRIVRAFRDSLDVGIYAVVKS